MFYEESSFRLRYAFVAVRTMFAAIAATFSPFKMIGFGEYDVAAFIVVKVNSFNQILFHQITFLIHCLCLARCRPAMKIEHKIFSGFRRYQAPHNES